MSAASRPWAIGGVLAVIVALVVFGWFHFGSPFRQSESPSGVAVPMTAPATAAPGARAFPAAARTAAPAARTGPRKCAGNGTVLYTDDACPKGTRELAVDRGSLTVLAAPPPPPSSAASPAGLPNARDILAPPGGVDIKARQIEQAIGN